MISEDPLCYIQSNVSYASLALFLAPYIQPLNNFRFRLHSEKIHEHVSLSDLLRQNENCMQYFAKHFFFFFFFFSMSDDYTYITFTCLRF